MILARTLFLGAALYALPKAATYLCTKPSMPASQRIEQIQGKMIFFQERLRDILGNRQWYILTGIVADNAWISYFALSYLNSGANPAIHLDKTTDKALAFSTFCASGFLIRFGVAYTLPFLKSYVGVRPLAEGN